MIKMKNLKRRSTCSQKVIMIHQKVATRSCLNQVLSFWINWKAVLSSYDPPSVALKIYPPLSSILLTSYTSHIPTHHPSYLNNFFTINYIIKSCSGTSLSLPGNQRMISGFSSIDYPIPTQSPKNTPLIWIRNWLFLFRFFLVIISITI